MPESADYPAAASDPGAPTHATTGVLPSAPRRFRAFISYSHADTPWANWLLKKLEGYRVPARFHGRAAPVGEVGPRLAPVFRDRDELPTTSDLGETILAALRESATLIVICSPQAAKSRWVREEIVAFKRLHGGRRVFALIVAGEPKHEGAADDCFSPALRRELAPDGTLTGAPAEVVAADAREQGDGKAAAFIRLVAGLIGVGFDDLRQRELQRRSRRLTLIAAASFAGMVLTLGLALAAWRARGEAVFARNDAVLARNEAQDRSDQAEDLIEFMLGDLRKKLKPVGRLDVLDGVGEQALAYYARQDASKLEANSLGRRSRAFHLLGELHEQRGQLEQAAIAFTRAADTTAQALARAPQDGQRIFDHAQSVYWVGYLAWRRGEAAAAEAAFRRYVELADRLVQVDGRNLDWLAETAYAHVNVGVVYLNTMRLAEAAEAFAQARAVWERIVPSSPARAMDFANTVGWIAKTREAKGDFDGAIAAQQEKIRILELVPNAATNQLVKRHLRVVNNDLAGLALALGRVDEARQFSLTGVQTAKALVAVDAANTSWLEQLVISQIILAETQLASNDRAGARENVQAALAGATKLLARDSQVAVWQVNLRGLVLIRLAVLAGDDERRGLIDQLKEYLVKVREYTTGDRGVTQVRDLIVARAEARLALLLAAENRADEATARWQAVAARVQPYAAAGDLPALTLLAHAQFRLGAIAEARALCQQIESTPYRHPAYADLVQLVANHAELANRK
jgi:tetratricopeptide (TPR) repeat protein